MKTKFLVLAIIFSIIFVIAMPITVNAADTYTAETTTNGQTVKWSYELNDNNQVTNLKCTNISDISGKVEIPSKIDGKNVILIASEAFNKCSGLTEILIPNSIRIINYSAFRECTGLKSITIPDSVTAIGDYAFGNCSGLKNVTLSNNLTKISTNAFVECSGLKTLKLPDKITTISSYAFWNCSGLTSMLIPESVASIAENAFGGVSKEKFTIYGVKGSAAEEFATAQGYKFDVIENYGKTATGSDVTAPTVKSIDVTSPAKGTYGAGQKVTINVNFSEKITAKTMPTLKIKFGTGTERAITSGVLSGSTITYTYTIASGDAGQLLTSSLTGGDVTDAAGNKATLTCPLISGNAIVAGNSTSSSGTSTNNTKTSTTSDSKTTSTSQTSTDGTKKITVIGTANTASSAGTTTSKSATSTSSAEDPTVAKTNLPKTGEGMLVGTLIITITAIGIFAYIKTRKYRDIV